MILYFFWHRRPFSILFFRIGFFNFMPFFWYFLFRYTFFSLKTDRSKRVVNPLEMYVVVLASERDIFSGDKTS